MFVDGFSPAHLNQPEINQRKTNIFGGGKILMQLHSVSLWKNFAVTLLGKCLVVSAHAVYFAVKWWQSAV